MEQKNAKWLGVLYDLIEIAVLALVIVAALYAIGFRQAEVDGRSMEDTLQHGERLLLSNFFYQPAHGDVVVINRYDSKTTYTEWELSIGETEPLVKRVIGVGGDTVRITENEVYVNGKRLDEPYTKGPNDPSVIQVITEDGLTEQAEITVPDGYIFVMGDHRDDSKDSRMAAVGLVKETNVLGKAVWRLSPFGPLS